MRVITKETLEELLSSAPEKSMNQDFLNGSKFILQTILQTDELWQEAELKEVEENDHINRI